MKRIEEELYKRYIELKDRFETKNKLKWKINQ